MYSSLSLSRQLHQAAILLAICRSGQTFLAYWHCFRQCLLVLAFLYAIRSYAVSVVGIVVIQSTRAVDVALVVSVGGVRSAKPPARNIQGLTYMSSSDGQLSKPFHIVLSPANYPVFGCECQVAPRTNFLRGNAVAFKSNCHQSPECLEVKED